MISADLVGFSGVFLNDLKEAVREKLPDFYANKLFINATHTHNAPGIEDSGGLDWMNPIPGTTPPLEYRSFLLKRMAAVAEAAWQARKPGGIAHGLGYARIGHCRRAVYADGTAEMYGNTTRNDFVGMEGGEDSGVDMMFTFDTRGKPTGMILNLACPSQVMESTYKISSDFIGETRRLLKQRYGKNFRILAQISAAGCQSPRDLVRNYKGEPDFWHEDGVAEIGRRLLTTVESVFSQNNTPIDFAPSMQHRIDKISLPKRRVPYLDYLNAKKKLSELEAFMTEEDAYLQFCAEVRRNEKIPGRPGPYDSKLHHFVLIQNNKAIIARNDSQTREPMFEFEAHFMRLGKVVFATNPFELYLDFGHQIKARSAAIQTFLIQLSPGDGGYLPTARAEQLGGYGGLIIDGVVGSNGGKILVDKTVSRINEFFR